MTSDEIFHYGIKRRSGRYPYGSGDRPFQSEMKKKVKTALKGDRSYFRGGHTIPKGTVVYRTTSSEKDYSNGSTYVTYLEPDRNLYRGGQIRLRDGSQKSYEHRMELKEDLKVPSREILKEATDSVVKNNPKLVREIAKGWIDVWMPEGSLPYFDTFWDDELGAINKKKVQKMIDEIVKNYKNKTIDEAFAMNTQSLGASPKFKEALIADLKKKGYNAMVDEAGVGAHVAEGVDPLIVFDSNKSLNYQSTSNISRREENKARQDYMNYIRKTRQRNRGDW